MKTKIKSALIVLSVLSALLLLGLWDNHDLHAWYKTTVRQAQSEGLVPISGMEDKSSDLINPVSWVSPAPYRQWFIPQTFVGTDIHRGKKNMAVRVVVYSKSKPYREEFIVVYLADRQSYAVVDLEDAKSLNAIMESSLLKYEKHDVDELHVAILKLLAKK